MKRLGVLLMAYLIGYLVGLVAARAECVKAEPPRLLPSHPSWMRDRTNSRN